MRCGMASSNGMTPSRASTATTCMARSLRTSAFGTMVERSPSGVGSTVMTPHRPAAQPARRARCRGSSPLPSPGMTTRSPRSLTATASSCTPTAAGSSARSPKPRTPCRRRCCGRGAGGAASRVAARSAGGCCASPPTPAWTSPGAAHDRPSTPSARQRRSRQRPGCRGDDTDPAAIVAAREAVEPRLPRGDPRAPAEAAGRSGAEGRTALLAPPTPPSSSAAPSRRSTARSSVPARPSTAGVASPRRRRSDRRRHQPSTTSCDGWSMPTTAPTRQPSWPRSNERRRDGEIERRRCHVSPHPGTAEPSVGLRKVQGAHRSALSPGSYHTDSRRSCHVHHHTPAARHRQHRRHDGRRASRRSSRRRPSRHRARQR